MKVQIRYYDHIPEYLHEDTLAITYFSNDSSEEIILESKIDFENNSVSAYSNKSGEFCITGELILQPQPLGWGLKEFASNEWLSYSDNEYGITFRYLPNWDLTTGKDNLEKDEIASLQITGDKQINETELFDGANLTFYKAEKIVGGNENWLLEKERKLSENYTIIDKSDMIINNRPAYKYKLEEMGYELTLFLVINSDTVITADIYSVGENREYFKDKAIEIINTLDFLY